TFPSNNCFANSAPLPNQLINSRSGSSLALNSTYQHHHYDNNRQQQYHNYHQASSSSNTANHNPIIMRNADKHQNQIGISQGVYNGSSNGVLYRPISANELRSNSKPVFGRKQFNNQTNMTANLAAKNLF